jgi:O-antigen chain-terminating methyltransferase
VESAELIAILREVRDRVRAGNPETAAGGTDIALPDLLGLLHARDAALGKVAAIGTVNPRSGGPLNWLIQSWKRLLARVLDWHVREQVEFNRRAVACVDADLEALNEFNRTLVELGNRLAAERGRREELDKRLGERIAAERGLREDLERQLRERISAERARREDLEKQLRRETDQHLGDQIAAERALREELDKRLGERIAVERGHREELDKQLREETAAEWARLEAERTRREELDGQLREQIAAEWARREAEWGRLEAERGHREELDKQLREQIAAERTRLEELERRVGERIGAERAHREDLDKQLREELGAERARRVELEGQLRQVTDQQLGEQIAAERVRLDAESAHREELERQFRQITDQQLGEQIAAERARLEAEWAYREELEKQLRRVTDQGLGDQIAIERARLDAEWGRLEELERREREQSQQLSDIRDHWAQWRPGWEQKLATNEIQFLRSVADLDGAFQYRLTLMDSNYRESVRAQHNDFTVRLDQRGIEIQKHLWADLERVRAEFDKMIHVELRLIRQRTGTVFQSLAAPATGVAVVPSQPAAPLAFDYARFAESFRGSEERVKEAQRIYVADFKGCGNVLDIGCGRGEFLELMREAGVQARGIDSSLESIAVCREKGLEAETADLFDYLRGLDEGELDGIFCAQVVEHLPPERLPEMIRLAASRLDRNGIMVIETPNPECLAIFTTYFYLDPTHYRPVPAKLLAFYLSEFGIGDLQVRRMEQAVDALPALADLPAEFREVFFGGLDYAIVGKKI